MTDIHHHRFSFLFDRYLQGIETSAEKEELAALSTDIEPVFLEALFKEHWFNHSVEVPVFSEAESNAFFEKIVEQDPARFSSPNFNKRKWIYWLSASAAVFLLVAGLIMRFDTKTLPEKPVELTEISADMVKPGGNKAFLKLDDGRILSLFDIGNGFVLDQYGSSVIKLDEGKLAYKSRERKSGKIAYNTIETPRGGQYQLELPDGSKAILNSSSSIKFPSSFTGSERKVEITGEVYFEVAPDKLHPFRVYLGDMMVEALGTSFNIMGYDDEEGIRVNLITGEIKVAVSEEQIILKPGQETIVGEAEKLKVFESADPEQSKAWTDGWFRFSGHSAEEVLRQISRWYDLDVVYETEIPQNSYTGMVSRDSDLSKVLVIMERAGMKFRIMGKTLIVRY